MKTSELIGEPLDYWAHLASGVVPVPENELSEYEKSWSTRAVYWRGGDGEIAGSQPVSNLGSPSTDWGVGGPIIESEQIATGKRSPGFGDVWAAGRQVNGIGLATHTGPTLLIAAMRALVASKYGDEVPDES